MKSVSMRRTDHKAGLKPLGRIEETLLDGKETCPGLEGWIAIEGVGAGIVEIEVKRVGYDVPSQTEAHKLRVTSIEELYLQSIEEDRTGEWGAEIDRKFDENDNLEGLSRPALMPPMDDADFWALREWCGEASDDGRGEEGYGSGETLYWGTTGNNEEVYEGVTTNEQAKKIIREIDMFKIPVRGEVQMDPHVGINAEESWLMDWDIVFNGSGKYSRLRVVAVPII